MNTLQYHRIPAFISASCLAAALSLSTGAALAAPAHQAPAMAAQDDSGSDQSGSDSSGTDTTQQDGSHPQGTDTTQQDGSHPQGTDTTQQDGSHPQGTDTGRQTRTGNQQGTDTGRQTRTGNQQDTDTSHPQRTSKGTSTGNSKTADDKEVINELKEVCASLASHAVYQLIDLQNVATSYVKSKVTKAVGVNKALGPVSMKVGAGIGSIWSWLDTAGKEQVFPSAYKVCNAAVDFTAPLMSGSGR
ncbi:hypothetical protein AB0G95_33140 [Streptomyces virginiae]|uniref:hypothetical protein n=1 Tax=Streptomyces virginiae TaxID=1961 RepID=UPI00343B4736